MSIELVVVIPTRDRPHTVQKIAEGFAATCTAWTSLLFVVDSDDPNLEAYREAVANAHTTFAGTQLLIQDAPANMIMAANTGALKAVEMTRGAIAFMGDDHMPRSIGWDRAYVDALKIRPGIVFGDDLLQRYNLPTQFAISAQVIDALGFISPPTFVHMYMDNYWLRMGHLCEVLTYLPDVIVEHMHFSAGKSDADAGYERVNAAHIYAADKKALEAHLDEFLMQDRQTILAACAAASRENA